MKNKNSNIVITDPVFQEAWKIHLVLGDMLNNGIFGNKSTLFHKMQLMNLDHIYLWLQH